MPVMGRWFRKENHVWGQASGRVLRTCVPAFTALGTVCLVFCVIQLIYHSVPETDIGDLKGFDQSYVVRKSGFRFCGLLHRLPKIITCIASPW